MAKSRSTIPQVNRKPTAAKEAEPRGAPVSRPGKGLDRYLGNVIRELRTKDRLTIADVAGQAGMSRGMLSKIENGTGSASLESLESLARALNVPLTSFFASYEERRDCSFVKAGKGVTHRAPRHQGRPPVPAARPFTGRRDRR